MHRIFFIFLTALCFVASTGCDIQTAHERNEAYENDLTERCKDWYYWREQIIIRHQNGDINGEAEARRNMTVFMRDLESRFDRETIDAELSRILDSATKKRVKPWSSAAGSS